MTKRMCLFDTPSFVICNTLNVRNLVHDTNIWKISEKMSIFEIISKILKECGVAILHSNIDLATS